MICKQCGYYAAHEYKGVTYELCSECLINDVIDFYGSPTPQSKAKCARCGNTRDKHEGVWFTHSFVEKSS